MRLATSFSPVGVGKLMLFSQAIGRYTRHACSKRCI
jgi:hypothetical protein